MEGNETPTIAQSNEDIIKQEEYKSMNKKIEEALEELRYAKESIKNAYTELEKDYVSRAGSEKVTTLIEEYNNINKVIEELTEILAKSKEKEVSKTE